MQADYTGLGALAWEGYASDPNPEIHPDIPMWLQVANELGGPILDVGCATGRVLIPLVKAGFEVDGIDPSADALAICSRKLAERNLAVNLACQTMQTLNMARQYRAIFVPCGTIQLVVGRDAQKESISRLFAHLLPGGTLVMTLYNESGGVSESDVGVRKIRSRRKQPDGTELEKAVIIHSWNPDEQTVVQQVRYRLYRGEAILQEEICEANEQWYSVSELAQMLESAGFTVERVTGNYGDAPADATHYVYTFRAKKESLR
ncbi:MAG: methyltransferase domain-containing protein [Capsulimonadales bacterium]|nr:methyltransferase domain-containing protein [Capsulimonadales bacterium]